MQAKPLRLIAISIFLLLPILLAAPVAAQSSSPVQNATDAAKDVVESGDNDELEQSTNEKQTILHQFDGGGSVLDIEYRDGATFVTLKARDGSSQDFSVGEVVTSGEYDLNPRFTIPAGETRTIEIEAAKAKVNVATAVGGGEGWISEGAAGPPVLTSRPTDELVQLAVVSTMIGAVLSLSIAIGRIRRQHENSYTELFSDETKRIEQDAYEGWRDRIIQWFESRYESKLSTVVGIGILLYIGGVVTGVVPAPRDLWLSLSDGQRLGFVATSVATVLLFPVMYYLGDRLYQPEREYILDMDSKDVYRAEAGDKSGTVAAYSAPPERISEMDVDGGVTTIGTPGGRGHLVRGFDPEQNEASGNPPDIADDRQVSIEVQKIDHNRQILTDLATIGRDLIGAMSAFRVTADSAAMKDIDSGLRNTVSAGDDSMEDVLQEAVSGTRYEGSYNPETAIGDIEEEEEQSDPSNPKGSDPENHQTEQLTNGSGDDD